MTVEEAQAAGIDAVEFSKDFATSGKGQTIEGSRGHMTVVVDRERKVLVGRVRGVPERRRADPPGRRWRSRRRCRSACWPTPSTRSPPPRG